MAIYSRFTHEKRVIFHSYVSLPEGIMPFPYLLQSVLDSTLTLRVTPKCAEHPLKCKKDINMFRQTPIVMAFVSVWVQH